MKTYVLMLCLLSTQLAGTIITDSFLHEGCAVDRLVFYIDSTAKVHVSTKNKHDKNSVTVRLLQTKVHNTTLLSRINHKTPRDYTLSCTSKGRDITCTFCFPVDAIKIQVEQTRNWQSVSTLVITITRTITTPVARNVQPLIVIDYGHGGEQSGALGLGGLVEKDVVLSLGEHITRCLIAKGYRVLVTRSGDYAVALDERTSFANHHHADALISLHCNYAANEHARGIETFYGNDLSKELAHNIHTQLVHAPLDYDIVDRGVKRGLLQMVYGCECPAILIELFFLSNPADVAFIKDPIHQQMLVQQLCAGIARSVAVQPQVACSAETQYR